MFHNKTSKLVILGQGLFMVLFLAAAWHYRSTRLSQIGCGFFYFCLSGCLAAFSELPESGKPLLSAGYLALAVGFLNYAATLPGAAAFSRHAVLLSLVVCIAYYFFLSLLVWAPIQKTSGGFPLPVSLRGTAQRTIVAAGFAYMLSGGVVLALVFFKHSASPPVWSTVNPFQFAMLFATLSSLILAAGLFWSLGTHGVWKAKHLVLLVAFLTGSGLVERWLRNNGMLFLLSSLALAGAFTSFLCVSSAGRGATTSHV